MIDLLPTIFPCALFAIALLATLRLESVIERLAILPPKGGVEVVGEIKSLRQFKHSRDVLALLAGFEATLGNGTPPMLAMVGGVCVLSGIALRLSSIAALGEMWSFHPLRYANHRLVSHGVYRYLRHPAYLGNIYLPGLFLGVGAPVAAVLALLMIAAFYYHRAGIERTLLADLRDPLP